jgi:hypothetical protein
MDDLHESAAQAVILLTAITAPEEQPERTSNPLRE